jgi:hypothetical protein
MSKKNPLPTEKKANSAARTNPLSWLVFAAICALLVWSCRAFLDYGGLWLKLRGKSMIERGRIGANEWQSFLARAGRANTQKAYAETRAQIERALAQARLAGKDSVALNAGGHTIIVRSVADLPSQVADGWAWVMETEKQLPPDAKIFLNVPASLYYYYCSAFWYPRRVDVNTERVGIRDDQTLAENARPVAASELGKLRELGYTHIVASTARGIQLIDLREPTGGVKP